jgi:hypothetical protein
VVVDHIDHITSGGKGNDFSVASEVNDRATDMAKEYGVVLVAMSQANAEAIRRTPDHLAKYAPLIDTQVWMGSKKRQVATSMLGLFRPLRTMRPGDDADAYKKALADARAGTEPPQTMLELGVTGVSLMKSRTYGSREGQKVLLGYDRGAVMELPLDRRRDLEASHHWIHTRRDAA